MKKPTSNQGEDACIETHTTSSKDLSRRTLVGNAGKVLVGGAAALLLGSQIGHASQGQAADKPQKMIDPNDFMAFSGGPRLVQTAISVSDMERSLHFYTHGLGMKAAGEFTLAPGLVEKFVSYSHNRLDTRLCLLPGLGPDVPKPTVGFTLETDDAAALCQRHEVPPRGANYIDIDTWNHGQHGYTLA